MVLLTNKLNTKTFFTLDNDGELMICNEVTPGEYDQPMFVQWDNLDEDEMLYYMDRHMYLLDEVMPEISLQFYPRF